MKIQKISDLEEKAWYRFLKVIFILTYLFSEIAAISGFIYFAASEEPGKEGLFSFLLVMAILGIPIFHYLVRHIFLYIVSGKWNLK